MYRRRNQCSLRLGKPAVEHPLHRGECFPETLLLHGGFHLRFPEHILVLWVRLSQNTIYIRPRSMTSKRGLKEEVGLVPPVEGPVVAAFIVFDVVIPA